MICNFAAMYLYYKGFKAMMPEEPKHRGHPRTDDTPLKDESFHSSLYDRRIRDVLRNVHHFEAADIPDKVRIAQEIYSNARDIRGWKGTEECAQTLKHLLINLDSQMPKSAERDEVKVKIAESILAITRDSARGWEGWLTLIGPDNSDAEVAVGLKGLLRSSKESLNAAGVPAKILAAAERSDECAQVTLGIIQKFSSETFKAHKDTLLKLGEWSMENSRSREYTVRAFTAIELERELIPSAVKSLEAGFVEARAQASIELQRSKLANLAYCFPREVFTATSGTLEAASVLERLEKLRDEAYEVVGDSGTFSGWYAPWLSKVCADIRVHHDFESIPSWETYLIPLLREPISLMGRPEFRNLSEKYGDRVLAEFEARVESPHAKHALPALEGIVAELVSRSLRNPRIERWALDVQRVDALCDQICEAHQLERTQPIAEIIAQTSRRQLLDCGHLLNQFGGFDTYLFRDQVVSAIVQHTADILNEQEGSPVVLRAFYAGEVDLRRADRNWYDVFGKIADSWELLVARWGSSKTVRARAEEEIAVNYPHGVAQALLLIDHLARTTAH